MTGVRSMIAVATLTCAVSSGAWAQSSDQLTPHKVKISAVDYQGKHAVKMPESKPLPAIVPPANAIAK